jgi:hypothetical protein
VMWLAILSVNKVQVEVEIRLMRIIVQEGS